MERNGGIYHMYANPSLAMENEQCSSPGITPTSPEVKTIFDHGRKKRSRTRKYTMKSRGAQYELDHVRKTMLGLRLPSIYQEYPVGQHKTESHINEPCSLGSSLLKEIETNSSPHHRLKHR